MGRIGQAIDLTNKCYSGEFIIIKKNSHNNYCFLRLNSHSLGLLESNQNLLFMLKCRQFVEMVNGSDLEVSKTSTIKFFRSNETYFFSLYLKYPSFNPQNTIRWTKMIKISIMAIRTIQHV